MSAAIRKPLGLPTPKAIMNRESVGGQPMTGYPGFNHTSFNTTPARVTVLYSAAPSVFAKHIDVQGGGTLAFLRVIAADATSRTIRARLTLDGVVVFDATSAAQPGASSATAMEIVGTVQGGGGSNQIMLVDPIPFSKSCVFEVMSSTAETTNQVATVAMWRTN